MSQNQVGMSTFCAPTSYTYDDDGSSFNFLKALAFEEPNVGMIQESSSSVPAWGSSTEMPPLGVANNNNNNNNTSANITSSDSNAAFRNNNTYTNHPPQQTDYNPTYNYTYNNDQYHQQQQQQTPQRAPPPPAWPTYYPEYPSYEQSTPYSTPPYGSGYSSTAGQQQWYGRGGGSGQQFGTRIQGEVKPLYSHGLQPQHQPIIKPQTSQQHHHGNYKILSSKRSSGHHVNILSGNKRRGPVGYYCGKNYLESTNPAHVYHTQTYVDKRKAERGGGGLIKMIVNEATPLQIRYKVPQKEHAKQATNVVFQKPLSLYPGALKQIQDNIRHAVGSPLDTQTPPAKQKFSPTAIEFLPSAMMPSATTASDCPTARVSVFGHKKLKQRCPKCGERQATFYSLLTHVKSHGTPYCSQCCWMGDTHAQLAMHKEKAHPQQDKQNRSATMVTVTSKYGRKRQVHSSLALATPTPIPEVKKSPDNDPVTSSLPSLELGSAATVTVTSKYGRKRQVHSSLALTAPAPAVKKSPKNRPIKAIEVKKEKFDEKPPGKYFLRHS